MTRKKTFTKDPSASSGQALLLEALRSNLHLLGEIAMRYEVETQPERPEDPPSISCPDDVRRLLGPEMAPLAQEQLRVLLLDTRNNVLGQRVVYQGNVNSSIVRPAEVLRPAVIEAVPSIVVSHNHPSGDPTPSPEDAAITRELAQAAKLLGIELLDHVVIGGEQVRQPQGTGPHVLTALAVRLSRRGNRPRASPRHIHTQERRLTMLATHDLSADKAGTIDPEDLYTISAGGFSAAADAFARDDATDGLWFVSMVGSQTALKAIWASLLKQPPDTAHIIKGADGMALSGGYQRCVVPYETIGTWTTKIARLPVSGGWHALVYTKQAEYGFEKSSFLLLAQAEDEAPALHHRFLDKRSPLPLHGSWANWLWDRGLDNGEIVPLQSVGVSAYRCSPKADKLREDLSYAVASGWLTLPRGEGETDG